jgi:transposase
MDESIFLHDALVRRKMWTAEGIRPVVKITGLHQRTCVLGALCTDGRKFFRQYSVFNQETFLKYLKELQRKFGKIILFIDRARQHHESKMVRTYLTERNDVLRVVYFPKGSPEFNAVEECWKQGKYDLLVSKYYPRFIDLKKAIAEYYRTKRFNIDIVKYLLRSL